MNSTIEYLVKKFKLELVGKPPFNILNTNRQIMAITLQELGFKLGVEVGVAQGWHSKTLCQENPDLKLYCVDIWGQYPGYREYIDRIDRYYKVAQETLAPYNCVFAKKFSMEAVKDFANESLDFVYLDGAHDFKNVADDLCEWSKRVKIGGIVYGHDYKRWRPKESKFVINVKDVVQAYCYAMEINPWFVLGTQGKNDGMFREGTQSWMFVRQQEDLVEAV